jgi:hypothetical protein
MRPVTIGKHLSGRRTIYKPGLLTASKHHYPLPEKGFGNRWGQRSSLSLYSRIAWHHKKTAREQHSGAVFFSQAF